MPVIDLHCDTMLKLYHGEHLDQLENTHISMEKLKRGDCMAQCFAIFVPTHENAEKKGITGTPQEYVSHAYEVYLAELERQKDSLAPALSAADIRRNREKGLMSAVLTIEDAVSLDGKIERVDEYFRMGVRMVALTWNYENSVGFPNSSEHELHIKGLKPFGFDVVERMNELGIAVDVSHLSEGGFWDVAKVSRKPFIASHSCARALCDHSRNLTDEQLRAIGNAGGVVGVNFYDQFLHIEKSGYSSCEDVVRHLTYIADKAGIEALAIGSDFDGIESKLEWDDYSGYPKLLEVIGKSFSSSEMELITHKNALRVLEDIIGA